MVTTYAACGVMTRMEDTVCLSYRRHFVRSWTLRVKTKADSSASLRNDNANSAE